MLSETRSSIANPTADAVQASASQRNEESVFRKTFNLRNIK
jgi:hypothetical protein